MSTSGGRGTAAVAAARQCRQDCAGSIVRPQPHPNPSRTPETRQRASGAACEAAAVSMLPMGALDTAKSVVSLAAEVNRMDLYKQAVEQMAQVTEQQQEIMRLTEEVAALRERLRLKESFTFVANAYWQGNPRSGGDNEDAVHQMGPYCSRCFDVLGRRCECTQRHIRVTSARCTCAPSAERQTPSHEGQGA